MSSQIVGTFTNASLSAKLVIASADDSTGHIQGTYTQGTASWPITGTWNTSTMQPNAVFSFTGSAGGAGPANIVAGVGAALDFHTFAGTTISVSNASAHAVVNTVTGPFAKS